MWEGYATGRGYGDICIADSLCYTAATNNVKQLYSNKDVKKKKEKEASASSMAISNEHSASHRTR